MANQYTYKRQYTDKKTGANFEVEVSIDLDAVAQELAARAYYSKGKKSQKCNGDIVCKVIDNEIN